jgi:chromate reductase, NAD(P)H dehydrogenase (quinone)
MNSPSAPLPSTDLATSRGAGPAVASGDTAPVRIAALLGSTRRGSLNAALLRGARAAAPDGVRIELVSLAGLPFYDGDLDAAGGWAAVRAFRRSVAEADGLLIVTPEYNGSLPAIVKNAIDWASRPRPGAALAGKPVLTIGATAGRSAVRHALQHAADVLAVAQAVPFPGRYGLSLAGERLDPHGELTDPEIRRELRDLLAQFADVVRERRDAVQNARRTAGQTAA